MEGAIEKDGTQERLLEADDSHFHKSKHFQGDLPLSYNSGLQKVLLAPTDA